VTALIAGALIAVVAAVIVAWPFLRSPDADEPAEAADTGEYLALMETRDRALAALKELEFDHRTGKIDDTDYRRLVGPLRRAAAEALQGLDRFKAARELSRLEAAASGEHPPLAPEAEPSEAPPTATEAEAPLPEQPLAEDAPGQSER
jgi:hypothetical protein